MGSRLLMSTTRRTPLLRSWLNGGRTTSSRFQLRARTPVSVEAIGLAVVGTADRDAAVDTGLQASEAFRFLAVSDHDARGGEPLRRIGARRHVVGRQCRGHRPPGDMAVIVSTSEGEHIEPGGRHAETGEVRYSSRSRSLSRSPTRTSSWPPPRPAPVTSAASGTPVGFPRRYQVAEEKKQCDATGWANSSVVTAHVSDSRSQALAMLHHNRPPTRDGCVTVDLMNWFLPHVVNVSGGTAVCWPRPLDVDDLHVGNASL